MGIAPTLPPPPTGAFDRYCLGFPNAPLYLLSIKKTKVKSIRKKPIENKKNGEPIENQKNGQLSAFHPQDPGHFYISLHRLRRFGPEAPWRCRVLCDHDDAEAALGVDLGDRRCEGGWVGFVCVCFSFFWVWFGSVICLVCSRSSIKPAICLCPAWRRR